jgi:Zn-finger nucleic acid-binding protein
MKCPRDGTELSIDHMLGIEVDRCLSCHGRWLDSHELDQLEATVDSTEEERRATISFGELTSDLKCPVCEAHMTAFNYRAYNLELDMCDDGHGYWLDAGEEGRVRDIIAERVRDLQRAASAESAWGKFLSGLKGGPRRT